MVHNKKRILLGQLAARGDCLYATTVAKQIKHDFPHCHLTWAVGSMCKSILDNNPYVDATWEFSVAKHADVDAAWKMFVAKAEQCKKDGLYDEVFLTQISPGNFQNFDGTVRRSLFRGYPYPITVSLAPVIRLTQEEIAHVTKFVEDHSIKKYSQVIVFEYASHSDQSFVTLDFALACAQELTAHMKDLCVILSSHLRVNTAHDRIFDAHVLSFRENAELLRYCTLFIGCSSGISWLSTADWVGRQIPTIQLLKKKKWAFASMIHDFEYFGLPTDMVIEMTECSVARAVACFKMVLDNGIEQAKNLFHEKNLIDFDFYSEFFWGQIAHNHYKKAFKSMTVTVQRYGMRKELVKALLYRLCRIIYYAITDRLYFLRSKFVKK